MSNTIKGGNWIAAITGGVFQLVRTLTRTETLLNTPAAILAAYLITESIGSVTLPTTNSTWPLYVSSLPDGRNVEHNALSIIDISGVKDGRSLRGRVYQHYGIQLTLRSRGYETGFNKMEAIGYALDDIIDGTVTKGGYNYEIKTVTRTSSILFLGRETDGTQRRCLFTLNLLTVIKRLS